MASYTQARTGAGNLRFVGAPAAVGTLGMPRAWLEQQSRQYPANTTEQVSANTAGAINSVYLAFDESGYADHVLWQREAAVD